MTRWSKVVCCALSVAVCGVASGKIKLWDGDPNYCGIDQYSRTVTITGPGTFKLEAFDDDGNLENINEITARSVSGAVHLYVAADPNYACCDGARYVHIIDLSGATDSSIEEVHASLSVADWDKLSATRIAGPVTSGGEISEGISVHYLNGAVTCIGLGDVTVDTEANHTGSIRVTGSSGYSGHLAVTGSMSGGTSAAVTIDHALNADGRIDISGAVTALFIGGDMAGPVTIGSNLQNCHVVGNVTAALYVSGSLTRYLQPWGLQVDGAVADSITITGALEYAHLASVSGTIQAADISDLTVVAALAGTVEATSGLADAHFDGGISEDANVTAVNIDRMTVTGSVEGTVYASGTLNGLTFGTGGTFELLSPGVIETDTLAGLVQLADETSGSVLVLGDLTGSLLIVASALPNRPNPDLSGTISVDGSVTGSIRVAGSITETGSIYVGGVLDDPDGQLTGGYIAIDRSLQAGATITINTEFTVDSEFIAIHYSGYEDGDYWDPNATVTVNGTACHADTPELNVREISKCKGDLNGDSVVDFDDINPFIDALLYQDVYSIGHPGLGGVAADGYEYGSRIFHGDLGGGPEGACDGALDFDDIDPFLARLSEGCCWEQCGTCPEGGDLMSAQQLAAGMRAHVPTQRHGALRAFVSQVIAHHANHPARRAYWQQVLAHLEQ